MTCIRTKRFYIDMPNDSPGEISLQLIDILSFILLSGNISQNMRKPSNTIIKIRVQIPDGHYLSIMDRYMFFFCKPYTSPLEMACGW